MKLSEIENKMVLISPTHWQKAMEWIRDNLGEEAFEAWIAPTNLEDFLPEQEKVVLSVPNQFYRRWISKRYLAVLEEGFSQALEFTVSIDLVIEENEQEETTPATPHRGIAAGSPFESGSYRVPTQQQPTSPRGGVPSIYHSTPTSDPYGQILPSLEEERQTALPPRLNPRYVFQEFVVGESNRYAHAASIAVADPKGKAFNPLFIYGGSGLGKTHLMQAIGHKVFEMDPRLRVVYVTSEHFINCFIDAIQHKKHMDFRNKFRNVDLLLIDDVQFLMGKERTQQEFFHTFNALYDAGKKVVVTSDRPPKDLSTLEERLRSRFEWGLLVDIQVPDLETRIAILRKKAEQEGIHLTSDILFYIAERVTENVREMEGVLKRLRMSASLHGRAIDLETARDALGHLVAGVPRPQVTIEDIQRAVCENFRVKSSELLGKNRSKKIAQPRHIAQYLSRKLTDLSFPDIAQKFGGKDHTSIIYACRKVEANLSKDSNLAGIVEYISNQLTKNKPR
jgi:chromosomal replication initiator protein